jgi:hypothetical protein
MNKRGMEMSLNVVIIAVIVLIVAVVLIFIFFKGVNPFTSWSTSCQDKGGVCMPECTGGAVHSSGTCQDGVCCYNGPPVEGG